MERELSLALRLRSELQAIVQCAAGACVFASKIRVRDLRARSFAPPEERLHSG